MINDKKVRMRFSLSDVGDCGMSLYKGGFSNSSYYSMNYYYFLHE